MTPAVVSILQSQILDRRNRLESALVRASGDGRLRNLLQEVDEALNRIENGSFGLCDTCHEPIEADRLLSDPLTRVCLDHLSESDKRFIEDDLELATRIQSRLLPSRALNVDGWKSYYVYRPSSLVGGDYCELVQLDDQGALFFAVGDVTGKGVAASLLMTHLNAILRSLLSVELPIPELMSTANRIFCESTLASHYATLVCGRAMRDGSLQLCNAGHCPPLLVGRNGVRRVAASGLPLGMFCRVEYEVHDVALGPGESLALYTDGVTEAVDPEGNQYSEPRLARVLETHALLEPDDLIETVLADLAEFRQGFTFADDLTMLILRRGARPEMV